MTRKNLFCMAVIIFGLRVPVLAAAETLVPLKDGKAPQTVDEVWAGYDPTIEPLEVEVYKEWEESDVVLRAVRYCIGTFKGKKSWMAAYYGFPKGGSNLPGLARIIDFYKWLSLFVIIVTDALVFMNITKKGCRTHLIPFSFRGHVFC